MPIYVDGNEIVRELVSSVEARKAMLRENGIAEVRACIALCKDNLQKSIQKLDQVSEEANPFCQILFKFLSLVTPNAYTQQLQQLEVASQAFEESDFGVVDYILYHFKGFAARNLNGTADSTVSAISEIMPALDYLIHHPSSAHATIDDQANGLVGSQLQAAHDPEWPQLDQN